MTSGFVVMANGIGYDDDTKIFPSKRYAQLISAADRD